MSSKSYKYLTQHLYSSFDQLDGKHPWMQAQPNGYVSYKVRELDAGKVVYFNYTLAKEMGLICADHPHTMNAELADMLLKTFSLQIINEYDELNQISVPKNKIKANRYMASRYLQLQHQNKQGKTSGDGRGIWNGVIKNNNKVWDVSSRGTGVTRLAPGAVQANRPLKTGTGEFGYGCGLAEIDELYGAAIMAEIMHLQGINTERVLCVIDLGRGYGIGVRAAQNLLRPAHIFMYLKQNKYAELKSGTDYLIDRQIANGLLPKDLKKSKNRYDELVNSICDDFAKFAAILDTDYIFAWLDWDGDNVLATAGIIDYGSVRQFGIRHDKYRYDDIERFSTNLNEQKQKAKLIVQVFLQIADYLNTKKRRPLESFAKHPTLQRFDKTFKAKRNDRILYRMGFSESQRFHVLKNKPALFEKFSREFNYFESAKISGSLQKVADGVNRPALFNMRAILRELPEHLQKNNFVPMKEDDFFKIILSSFAKKQDAKIREKHRTRIQNFQKLYIQLFDVTIGKNKPGAMLKILAERAQLLNQEKRVTGNALIQIVDELIQQTRKGLSDEHIQPLIDQLIYSYRGLPEVKTSRHYDNKPRLVVRPDIFATFLDLVDDHKEDI